MRNQSLTIPIIPIPELVFFPHITIPLLIEDIVYIKMIKNSVLNNELIGLALTSPTLDQSFLDDRPSYQTHKVLSVGKPIIIDENEKGIRVLLKGQYRVKSLNIIQNIPFTIARAQIINDRDGPTSLISHTSIAKLNRILELWLEKKIPDSFEREAYRKSLIHLRAVVDHICAFIIKDTMTRQTLLETLSLHERIYLLDSLLKPENPFVENPLVVKGIREFQFTEMLDQQEYAH